MRCCDFTQCTVLPCSTAPRWNASNGLHHTAGPKPDWAHASLATCTYHCPVVGFLQPHWRSTPGYQTVRGGTGGCGQKKSMHRMRTCRCGGGFAHADAPIDVGGEVHAMRKNEIRHDARRDPPPLRAQPFPKDDPRHFISSADTRQPIQHCFGVFLHEISFRESGNLYTYIMYIIFVLCYV